jgi:hypothetical protein
LITEASFTALELRRLREEKSTDTKRMNELNKILQDTIKNLGMDAKSKVEKDTGVIVNSLGMAIADYEKVSPVDLLGKLDTLKDIQNIGKLLEEHHYRPTANILAGLREFHISEDED